MRSLPVDRAARDMAEAIDFLLAHPAVQGSAVGVVGFCMGGRLALLIAAQQGDKVRAVVPFYGAPHGPNSPDWTKLTASVLGHFAEDDNSFPRTQVQALEDVLRGLGKSVEFHYYHGAGHAFANEENPIGTHHEEYAAQAWERTITFLRDQLR